MERSVVSEALSRHKWENVRFWDAVTESQPGTLHLRLTRSGQGVAIFVGGDSDADILDKPEVYECSLMRDPHKVIGSVHIMNLVYYCDYSVIDSPPRICFHDPNREFGITLNFSVIEHMHELNEVVSKVFTTEIPNLPGFYQITRFSPGVAAMTRKGKEHVCSLELLSSNEYLDETVEFGNTLRSSCHKVVASEQEIDEMDLMALLMEKSAPKNRVLGCWLKLLNLPSVEDFSGEVVEDYCIAEAQWKTRSVSQMNRSKVLRETIARLTEELLLTPFPKQILDQPNDFIHKFSFEVLMTFVQIDPLYIEKLQVLLPIFVIVIITVNPLIQADGSVKIDGHCMDCTRAKALCFWLFWRILTSAEHMRLFSVLPASSLKLFEDMRNYLVSKNSAFEALKCTTSDVADLSKSFMLLFCDILQYEDCCELWTVALASGSVHELMSCLLCVCCALIPVNFRPPGDEITWSSLFERVLAREDMDLLTACSLKLLQICTDKVRSLLA